MAFEINLLDNASGEDLDDLAVRVPNCRTFTAPTNLGFGGGHNLLAAETDAQYLFILNPDVEFLFPDTVRRLVAPGRRRGPGQSGRAKAAHGRRPGSALRPRPPARAQGGDRAEGRS